jgi:hypothetical protein
MRMTPGTKFTEWPFCKMFCEPKPITFEHFTPDSHPFAPRLDGTRRDSGSGLWYGFVRDGPDTTKSTTRGCANIDRLVRRFPRREDISAPRSRHCNSPRLHNLFAVPRYLIATATLFNRRLPMP